MGELVWVYNLKADKLVVERRYGAGVEVHLWFVFFFQAEDGIRDHCVTGVQTCALPICMFNANYQTGAFDLGGLTNRVVLNVQDTNTAGYLTYQASAAQNYLVKTQTEFAPGWMLTAFANYNGLFQNLNDNARPTPAQLTKFGKDYALQITNPAAGTYPAFNHVHKKTDMD